MIVDSPAALSSMVPSRLAASLVQSEIRRMSVECDRVGGINMSQGICDMPIPEPVRRGAEHAIESGVNHYTRYDGIEELRTAIADKMTAFNGIHVDPETEVVVSAGSTGAFHSACLALLEQGDEVLLFEPYYGYHATTLLAAGAVPIAIPLTPPEWEFDEDAIRRAITPRTRAIVVNTPVNPAGKIFSLAELERLAEIAVRYDLFVFTDEIYEYLVYDGRRHVSPGSLPALADRTITISGYSKTFSITGWRIGYAVGRAHWLRSIGHVSDAIYVCAPAPLQAGVARGIRELPPSFYETLRDTYGAKRDRFCAALERAGLAPHVPQGAYYVLADVSGVPGRNGWQKAMHILRETGVACVPGNAFYSAPCRDLVRFCFAKSDELIEEAGRRLQSLQIR
jgi:aminotransferase